MLRLPESAEKQAGPVDRGEVRVCPAPRLHGIFSSPKIPAHTRNGHLRVSRRAVRVCELNSCPKRTEGGGVWPKVQTCCVCWLR